MKRYTLGLALLGLASPLFAQTQDDALRYSRLQFGGTARTLGIGGASTAIGADLGTLSSNPAGLGLFQRSEVSFSPGLGLGNASARATNLGGTSALQDSRNTLHFANVAAAFASRRPDSDNNDWRGGTLAFGLTRVNDFNTSFSYRSTVPDSRSLFQRLREPRLSPGQTIVGLHDQLDEEFLNGNYSGLDGLAYANYLTNFDPVRGTNDEVINTPSSLQRTVVTQEETVLTKGSQTQFDIGYGASYRDRLYVGGAIGIVGTRFESTNELRETNDASNTTTSFGSLTLRDDLRTRGTGYNARLGLIYRPLDWLRVGLSAQTPTAFQLDDVYSSSLNTRFSKPVNIGNGQTISSASAATQEGRYSYRMTTPWRLNGGAAFVVGKYGFVSADAELVDYSQARIRNAPDLQDGDNSSFSEENARISQTYTSVVNLRVGAEARLNVFRVRAGYARYGDPFRDSRFDRTQTYYTGGLGIRQGNVTADLAGVYTRYNSVYSPYTLLDASQPEVSVNANRFTTTFTLGFQF